jgi:nucleoside 2-deoxyribosyltransferase
MRVYLAGALFGVAERRFNSELAAAIEASAAGVKVILPQDQTTEMLKLADAHKRIFRWCIEEVEKCDAVVAVLDGPDADSGTCIEVGYAAAKGKFIVGVRTDFRTLEDRGLNLMVSNICDKLIVNLDPDVDTAKLGKQVGEALLGSPRK